MNRVAGVTLSAVVGGISYFLSLGFDLPPGEDGFRFFATFGGIAGFGVGSIIAKRIENYKLYQIAAGAVIDLIIGSGAAVAYMLLLATGASPGVHLVVLLAGLLSVTFLCIGAILPLAGLSFDRLRGP
jgi:hypothetical protein